MNTNKKDVQTLLLPGLNTLFMKSYKSYENEIYSQIATVIKSNSESETYGWLNGSPSLREFVGERQINAIGDNKYVLENKTWEASLGINRSLIEDDKYGQIKLRVEELAFQSIKHKNQLVIETLIKGNNALCFDGSNFFSATHKYNNKGGYKEEQSNLNNLALTLENLKTSITAMGKFKGSNGSYLNIRPDTIIVPPELEWTAKELIYSDKVGETNTINPLKNSLKIIVSPYITDADSWYLLDLSGLIKPIILQERCPIEFSSLGSDSENGFMRDEYLFGVRGRYNAGYSYWQLAYANIP